MNARWRLWLCAGLIAPGVLLVPAGAATPATTQATTQPAVLKQWEFNTDGNLDGWSPSGHVTDVRVAGGVLSARVIDWDPIFVSPVFEIPSRHAQYIQTRIRTSQAGGAEFFWTGTLKTQYGGFSPGKQTPFDLIGDGQWHEYRVQPCWEPEGKIIRIRLDLPGIRGPAKTGPLYEVDYVRIVEPPQAGRPVSPEWTFDAGAEGWRVRGPGGTGLDEPPRVHAACIELPAPRGADTLVAPPVRFAARDRRFVNVRMSATAGRTATLGFATGARAGLHTQSMPILPDGKPHDYLVDLRASADWAGEVRLLTFQPSDAPDAAVRIEAIRVTALPAGAAEVSVGFFGLEDALPRAGQDLTISAAVRNQGGAAARDVRLKLVPPAGLTCPGPAEQRVERLWYGQTRYVQWPVRADEALAGKARLEIAVGGKPAPPAEADVRIGPSLGLAKCNYVPQPKPAKTDYQVGVYYFPGWNTWARWRPIADWPQRKPVLGWYDEANPEVADWQIKWAVEHGVRFFAVDWYWCRGSRQLDHWLHQAYFRSRYRSMLKFCLLWANHNPAGTHDEADLLAVTDYWIANYFRRPEYFRLGGRPVVVIFNTHGLTHDMGTSRRAGIAAALAKMRKRCTDAGVGGLYLIACTASDRGTIQDLKDQGYDAISGYNYPGLNAGPKQWAPYESMIDGYRDLWNAAADLRLLKEIPAVSGGWDSRPWHGQSALVRFGRTPELFERHLRDAKDFLDRRDGELQPPARACIIEAWNEWGEGSYIGPHREFGFGYLQAVRRVFAPDSPHPSPVTPRDVGLGPYDLARPDESAAPRTAWDFRRPDDRKDWHLAAQIQAAPADDALAGLATGSDPIIEGPVVCIPSEDCRWLFVEARCDRDEMLQLFWSTTTAGMCENNSVRVRLRGDGQFHGYWVDLAEGGCWTGLITRLRLDPVSGRGAKFAVRAIRFAAAKGNG